MLFLCKVVKYDTKYCGKHVGEAIRIHKAKAYWSHLFYTSSIDIHDIYWWLLVVIYYGNSPPAQVLGTLHHLHIEQMATNG